MAQEKSSNQKKSSKKTKGNKRLKKKQLKKSQQPAPKKQAKSKDTSKAKSVSQKPSNSKNSAPKVATPTVGKEIQRDKKATTSAVKKLKAKAAELEWTKPKKAKEKLDAAVTRFKEKSKFHAWTWKIFVWFVKIVVSAFVLGVFGLIMLFLVFGRDLPDVRNLKTMDFLETTVLYDREGNVLYNIFEDENREYVPLQHISPVAAHATLAIEDKRFYDHWGFDLSGIIRAQIHNFEEDSISQGASTITQQLAKNIFLSPERTYERKIKELLLSLQIEWWFSKDDILEMYLNKIAYGSNAYGIEAASRTFFGKSSRDVSLVESAVLASLPKAPSYFSPYGQNKDELMGYCTLQSEDLSVRENLEETPTESVAPNVTAEGALENPEGIAVAEGGFSAQVIARNDLCKGPDDPNYVKGRKDMVLQRMVEDGYITPEARLQAWQDGLTLEFLDPVHTIESPHFVFYVRELLEQRYGKELVQSGGLQVVTTLDPDLQDLAEEAIAEYADYNEQRLGARNAAMVSLDPTTGQVLAMIGSRDYWSPDIDGQVNVATSVRQPGSSFKPLVYAAAIQNGHIGSGTVLADRRTVFTNESGERYVPNNSDNKFKGSLTVRRALAQSRNIPAVKAFFIAGGEEPLLEFFDGLGIMSLREFKHQFNEEEDHGWTFHYGPSLAIGSGEVTLLEMVQSYATLANGGVRQAVNPILEVRDRDGNVIEAFVPESHEAISPEAAFIINDILSDVGARPAGSWRAGLTIPGHTVAAKTGTSNKKVWNRNYPNNLLTMGYTPSIATGVWVGNTDGSHLRSNAWGLTGAAPIWKAFMERALEGVPDEPFAEPEGLIWRGAEVFPSYWEQTNHDRQFRKFEEDEEKDLDIPESDFILTRSSQDAAAEIAPEATTTPDVPYGF